MTPANCYAGGSMACAALLIAGNLSRWGFDAQLGIAGAHLVFLAAHARALFRPSPTNSPEDLGTPEN